MERLFCCDIISEMKYFDKDFRKFTKQFIFVIVVSLFVIGAISDYLTNGSGGGEASVLER